MIRTISRLIPLAALAAALAEAAVLPNCTPTSLPQTVGSTVSITCSPNGGTAPYTFSISAGALPPGLTQDPDSGAISGELVDPAGPFSFTVTATDSGSASGSQVYSGTIVDPLSVHCSSTLGPEEVGVPYSNTCTATGGTPPYTWAITGTKPSGLTVVPSPDTTTGTISYTPAAIDASYLYQVGATDSSVPQQNLGQLFNGSIAPAVAITTTSLPAGEVGLPYSKTLTGSGGVPPYSWSATSLPDGLTIAPGSNMLTGTPASDAAGTASVNLMLVDGVGGMSATTLSLTVNSAPTITTTSPLPNAIVNTPYTGTFAATGGSGGYTWALSGGSLPAGLTLSAAGGLSGTATTLGTSSFSVTVTDSAGGTGSGTFSLSVTNASLTITTGSPLPNGSVGAAYNQTLSGSGGVAPYAWSLASGALPTGLTLVSSPTTASITGTPSAPGTATFGIQLSDSATPADTTTKTFSITIGAGLAISTSSALPNATVGVKYSLTLAATGGKTPYTWSITAGALPAGLTLNTSSGAITGTPGATGSASFTATVTDSASTTANQAFTLNVVAAPVITTASPLPAGTTGASYTATLAATGGTTPYNWTIASGALPAGLSLSTAGSISGTPRASGTFTFTVQLTDATSVTVTKAFSLTVTSTLTITTTTPLPTGETGVVYSKTLAVSGGTAPFTWTVTAGSLPPGLSLSADGTVSGTPSANGAFSFTVQVADSSKITTSALFALTIQPALQIQTSSALTGGAIGVAYSGTLAATGGAAPYTWSLTVGALPAGLTLSSAGIISGTPSSTGTFSFTAQVNDALGGSATRAFTMVIASGLTITTPLLPAATVGVSYSQTLAATGGSAPYTWSITSGTLPAGLSLSSAGSITGTPTATGTATFTVLVTDSQSHVASATFSITVAPALSITTTSLPGGNVGGTYSQTLAAAGGTPPYTWSIASGKLPDGLNLSASGNITGTFSAAGTFTFTAAVTDSASATATQKFTVSVIGGLSITTAATLPNASQNTAYSQTLSAAGGTPPYTWAVTSGALPAGLTLSAAGAISGTPTAAGTSTFTVTVTDSVSATASQQFTLIVAGLTFTTTSLPDGTIGQPYDQVLSATGGQPPYTFTKTAGEFPPGLSLSGHTLSGTPTTAGSFQFTVQVTDFTSATASQQFTIVVSGLTITTGAALPSAALGTAYSATLAATGTGPFTWAVTQGALPAGLTIAAASGTISGKPTAAGDFSFTLQVTDSTNATASQAFTLTVLSASFTGIPGTAASGQQISGTLALGAKYSSSVKVEVTLTFQPDASLASPTDDPAIQFASGGRTLSSTVAANSTAPVSFALQTGTVAGAITLTVSLQAGSAAALPDVLTQTIQIAPAVPSISSVSLATSGSGFNISVVAFSNTRELSQAVIQFTPASGQTLENSSVTVPLTDAANAWFQGSSSDQYGSQFTLTIPITLSNGSSSAIAAVSVVLTNSQGNSTSAGGSF
ncbi:MAG TPA: putative Ig domain-containing protein [Bryobacteraceae bacterium]|nr:putative Ig domain-containing protein [Bryobacteraceae bacterium]